MPLFKIPLLCVAMYGMHLAITPPVKAELREVRDDIPTSERIFRTTLRLRGGIIEHLAGIACSCELAMVLAHAYPASPLAMAVSKHTAWDPNASASDVRISFTFLVGWSVLMLGVLLRLACFRELGRLFTFEVTLRRNHRLVTSGPYAFVRHPSYIALVMVFAGMSTCIVGPGSWAMECGALDTRGGMALAATWMVSGTYGIVQLLRRTPVEDRIMQEEFGEAWREWATRVPWRLIPGVY